MPQHWNNMLVVTKEELVPHFYSWDNLRQNINRYKNKSYGLKRVSIGGNGREMLISYDSLPKEIQNGLGDPRKVKHILERFYSVDGDAVAFFTKFEFPDGSSLDLEHQEKYITNASMLKAIIALRQAREIERRSKGGSLSGITRTLVSDAHSFQKALKEKHGVQHTLPESEKQFKAVLKAFEPNNYRSLISKKHKTKNALKVDDLTIELLNNLFTGQTYKPTATEVHRQYSAFIAGYIEVINNNSGEVYNPKDFKKLSEKTVTDYMAQWSNKIGNYAKRSGDRQKLMNQFKPSHSFDAVEFAGSMISVDDRQPPFKTPSGERVWFYNGIDLGSEAFTCWVHGESKEGIITEFYRQMVRNYAMWGFNLPAELECEMSLNSSFTDTFLREGAMFQYVKMEANNARGKRIERYFGELRYRIEKQRKGWLARPTALSEANQAMIPLEKVPAIPYNEIIEGCLQDIEDWNNQPHSRHEGKTRWEVFTEMQHPKLQPTNYAAILPYIGHRTVTSCKVGQVELNNGLFLIGYNGRVATGDRLIQFMHAIEGEQIEVYWLDDNYGEVLKAHAYIGTELICELVRKPSYSRATIERTDDDDHAEEIMSKYTATIDGFGRKQTAKLDRVTLIDNTPKPEKKFVMPGLHRNVQTAKDNIGEILEERQFDEIPNRPQSGIRPLIDRF